MTKRLLLLTLSALVLAGCQTAPKTWQAPVTPISSVGSKSYTVQRGDTIYGIANGFNIPVRKLVTANHLKWPYQLYIGQKVSLNEPTATQDKAYQEPATMAPMHQATAKPVYMPAPVAQKPTYTPPKRVAKKKSVYKKPTTSARKKPVVKLKPKRIAKKTPAVFMPKVSSAGWIWPANGQGSPSSAGGLNIATKSGQTVVAAKAGQVVYTGPDVSGKGKLVIVSHGDQMLSAYGNLKSIRVKEGAKLTRGDSLGRSSGTLHFEIRKDGALANVTQYLPRSA